MRRIVVVLMIILILVAVGFTVKEYNELRRPGVIVLLYHRVSNKSADGDKYTVEVNKFKTQLDYLVKEGYITVLPKDIFKSKVVYDGSKKIILSFDDGTEDHYSVVYPLLKERKMKAIFFIVTGYIGRYGLMTAREIEEMSKNGMEIGSHSYSHRFLDELEYWQSYSELYKSKSDLEKIVSEDVVSFAPPGGWFDDNVIAISQRLGYRAIFGCEIGTNDMSKRPYIYNRIEVLGDTSLERFKNLLNPPKLMGYKMTQSIKFLIHDILGSENYRKLQSAIY